MVKECLVLTHTDSNKSIEDTLSCIRALKRKGYRVIVTDHFFNKDIFQLADVYVQSYDNPILKPEQYRANRINHVVPTEIEDYTLYNPVSSFAAFAIIKLLQAGFKHVTTDRCLVLNYDWEMTQDIDRYYNTEKEAVFFRYADPKSVYTSIFILKKSLFYVINNIKTLDDYKKNMTYLEWRFYNMFKDQNVDFVDGVPIHCFIANKHYRISEKQTNYQFYALDDDNTLFVKDQEVKILPRKQSYTIKIKNKEFTANLSKEHFYSHYAIKK